MLASLASETQ